MSTERSLRRRRRVLTTALVASGIVAFGGLALSETSKATAQSGGVTSSDCTPGVQNGNFTFSCPDKRFTLAPETINGTVTGFREGGSAPVLYQDTDGQRVQVNGHCVVEFEGADTNPPSVVPSKELCLPTDAVEVADKPLPANSKRVIVNVPQGSGFYQFHEEELPDARIKVDRSVLPQSAEVRRFDPVTQIGVYTRLPQLDNGQVLVHSGQLIIGADFSNGQIKDVFEQPAA